MKQIFTSMIVAVALILAASVSQKTYAQPGVGVSITYQNFYDELSPHGRWIDYPEYGYVWSPNLGSGFQPYSTGGHWVWSDEYEWMWVSDYSWGWAPFHYGNWFHDDMYGWMWVPGYEWSPAWVSWRTGGDYYGWAPVRPGISISIGFGNYNPPSNYWCFAPRRYIGSRNIRNHYMDRRQNVTIINNTTIINNYGRRNNVFVNGGPRRQEAERYAGRINPVRFRESNSPGRTRVRNNEVSIYRPSIQRNNNSNFSPRNAERFDRNRQQGNGNVRREGIQDRDRVAGNNTRPDRRQENTIRDQSDRRREINTRDNNNRFPQSQTRAERPERNERPYIRERADRVESNPRVMEQRQREGRPQIQQREVRDQSQPRMERQREARPQVQQREVRQQSQPRMMEQRQREHPRMEQRQREQPRMEQRQQRDARPQFQQRESRAPRPEGGGGGGQQNRSRRER